MFKRTLATLVVTLFVLTVAATAFAESRKMGLFVGINSYPGKDALRSCVRDATNMQNNLVNDFGFARTNTTLLTDEKATRQGILNQLSNFENQASRGDLFVMYYSGHGSLFPDALSADRDETEEIAPPEIPSGFYDSTIVPIDARLTTSGKPWGNFILDDEINEIFARFTAKGVQVIFISDSCNSGTLARSLNIDGNSKNKFISPIAIRKNTEDWKSVVTGKGRKSDENFDKLFLVVASSLDTQYSIDQGAGRMSLFTEKFLETLDDFKRRNVAFTYNSIESEVKPLVEVQSDGRQTPRLDARFFDSRLLNRTIFSLIDGSSGNTGTIAAGNGKQLRIVVKVTDENGNPLPKAAFGVFRSNSVLLAGQVKKDDAYMLGRTDERGLFDSNWKSQTFAVGKYKIKVVKDGYKAYIRDMDVVEVKNGVASFVFRLVSE
jgi:hypothetical protein